MDDGYFDTLTRSLGTGQSRRRITRFLGGVALGGPLALLGLRSVEARCRKKCGPCKRCKQGKCRRKRNGTVCAGGTCQRGTCVPATPPTCGEGEVLCGTQCVRGICCVGSPCAGENCECTTAIDGKTVCVRTDFETVCRGCTSAGCVSGFQCVPHAPSAGCSSTTVCRRECASP